MTGKQVIKKLEEVGWNIIRITGSHHILSNGQIKVSVPVHSGKDIKSGTLHSIEKQSGVRLK
ncbi:MAG: type II toxin-antitoxin system HicA family toxin [Candidatus Riflebacteria bacterium]|nr:type II toxin-antitoxin system HicA family toxin [Candidatus Riflebacteria bacterium]